MSHEDGTGSGRFGFHALKKLMKGGDKQAAVDPDFENARKIFEKLQQQTLRVRNNLHLYLQAVRNLYNNGSTTGGELADILDDRDSGNPDNAVASSSHELRSSHISLASNEGIVRIANEYSDTSLKKLDDSISIHKRIADQISQRDKLKEEYEYYTKKVNEINVEMQQMQSKGKQPKPADTERLARNNSKLVETKSKYVSLNTQVLEEVRQLFASKIELFGPLANEFVTFENTVLSTYKDAIANTPLVHVSPSVNKPPPTIAQQPSFGSSSVNGTTSTSTSSIGHGGHSYNPSVSDPFAAPIKPQQNATPPAPPSYGEHSRQASDGSDTAQAGKQNPFKDLE